MGKYQPALLGGLFIGVLCTLPVVSMCCCLWVILGGGLVVYLQQKDKPVPVETGEAVLGGLMAGVIGAIIASVGVMLMTNFGGEMFQDRIRQSLDENGNIPPETRDMILNFMKGRNIALLLFLFNIPMYSVFSMAGSLLGLAVFRKKVPPQPPAVG